MDFFWFIVRFLAVTVGFAALHGYLWWRLCRDTTEPGSRWRIIGAVVLAVLALFGLGARFFVPSDLSSGFQRFFGWPGLIWFGTFMYLFGFLLLAEPLRWWLLRRRAEARPEFEDEPEPEPTGPSRRVVVSRAIGLSAGALAAATAGYGLVEGLRTPRLKDVEVPLARLDRAFDGYRIAVVGDTHLSALIGADHCRRVVEQINRSRPDLIAFVGDLASGEADDLREASEPLADLRSRHGAFFVSGNAEHYVGADAWYERVAELGMVPLPNTRVELPGFDLAGVNDLIVEQRGIEGETGPDLEAALDGRDPDRPLILMAHQPPMIDRAVDHGVDLQLSGHTHGGQMFPVHIAGKIRSGRLSGLGSYGDSQLYVTNGAGTNGPPMRVGANADITVMTLRSTRS
ncbi:metallophosphoesterase [Glycomyces sp. L485]|uniref:metallophosphoesterase n=1 Tax=Glycomyces sp. L485 TaxID=2909235 RepID=UPI001F4B4806|nr:metallophosphoesterase [Glycomyces sp. L485]MCH7232713.1 metallophosphoesterase [Glycomyces sp. L485]